jgi:hypothetical protein
MPDAPKAEPEGQVGGGRTALMQWDVPGVLASYRWPGRQQRCLCQGSRGGESASGGPPRHTVPGLGSPSPHVPGEWPVVWLPLPSWAPRHVPSLFPKRPGFFWGLLGLNPHPVSSTPGPQRSQKFWESEGGEAEVGVPVTALHRSDPPSPGGAESRLLCCESALLSSPQAFSRQLGVFFF